MLSSIKGKRGFRDDPPISKANLQRVTTAGLRASQNNLELKIECACVSACGCVHVCGNGEGIFSFQQHEEGAQIQKVPQGQGASLQAVRLEEEDLGLEKKKKRKKSTFKNRSRNKK